MKAKKILGLLLAVTMVAGTLAGCGDSDGGNDSAGGNNTTQQGGSTDDGGSAADGGEEANTIPFYMTLDPEVSGEIDIMCWSGDDIYHTDLGHWDPSIEEDLTSSNVAMIYAMAKKFNEMYPNVKINLLALSGDGGGYSAWSTELVNFNAEHGQYPDIYCSLSLPWDISAGLVADLSVYADDPLYQSFNPFLMEMTNYYGMQAALPQYALPWGVFVNKELAELNNIDVPDPDWTIDEYTEFVTSADNTNFWGLIYGDDATKFIASGTDTVAASILENNTVDIVSDQVMDLLDYIPQWSSTEVWAKRNEDAVPDEIMDDGWWWSWRFFCRNYVLTDAGDPWMMSDGTMAQNADGSWPDNAVQCNDWDIYPRPSTDYRGNTVGLNMDPVVLRNFAMDDGDPALSDSEKADMDLAYAFASYWSGSTEAMQARADQLFNNNGTLKSSLNDSFPLVVGDEYDKQMEIWYSTDSHKRFADANLMPGFQYVIELWEKGAINDYSDKCRPVRIMVDGTPTECLLEWKSITNSETNGTGILENDPSWLDTIKANLPEWNTKINARLSEAEENLRAGLKEYYGFTDADF